MDKELLVKDVHGLVEELDRGKVRPRFAAIVISQETGNWRLWIVPDKGLGDKKGLVDKREFYRLIAEAVSRISPSSIDVGVVELKKDQDPSVVGLSMMIRMEGLGSAFLSSNTFNGTLLPEGILVRSAL